MEYVTALHDIHRCYRQHKQIIEERLRTEIELFRSELQKFNPHSRCAIERWTFGIYQATLKRRVRMLQMLFE